MSEIHRFIHSLIKQIMNYLLSTCCMMGTVLRSVGGVNEEFKRTRLCHHEAYSLVGEVDIDQESHMKKHKVVAVSAWTEDVSNRGLTWSERSEKVSRESKV